MFLLTVSGGPAGTCAERMCRAGVLPKVLIHLYLNCSFILLYCFQYNFLNVLRHLSFLTKQGISNCIDMTKLNIMGVFQKQLTVNLKVELRYDM